MRSDPQLGAIFHEAMRIWDAQKAEGVALPDRLRGLRATLRAAWPQTREWKYLCVECADYGLQMRECAGDRTCGRERAHLPHEYGNPCWCEAGKKFRPKAKPTADDALAAAATVKKPQRLGRWQA